MFDISFFFVRFVIKRLFLFVMMVMKCERFGEGFGIRVLRDFEFVGILKVDCVLFCVSVLVL